MVTIFKTLSETNVPFLRDIDVIFNRIKSDQYKDSILKIRSLNDKEQRNILKKQLPVILFCGEFTRRKKDSCVNHSGYICLDFDGYKEDIKKVKENFIKDQYTLAVFVSPSGDGVKVIVKIPQQIENHESYFEALKKYYDSKYFDNACKDISRACYMSYDPDIYVNFNSKEWTEKIEVNKEITEYKEPIIKLTDSAEIIRRLISWWSKSYGMVDGARNNNLFILVSAFNEFGVPKYDAEGYCRQYEQKDFTINEINEIIDNVYKSKIHLHGTKSFEDKNKVDFIYKELKKGTSKKDIKEIVPVEMKVLDSIESDESLSLFWVKSDKGVVKHVNNKFKIWLEQNGFYKYKPSGSENFVFVRRVNNLISNVNEYEIKDFVLEYLLNLEDISIYEFYTEKLKYFKEDYLSILKNVDVDFKKDLKDTAYLYFQNCAVEVKKDEVNIIDYLDLDGYVWLDQVIKFDFELSDKKTNDYSKFLTNVSGKNYEAIKSVVGYLLHSYKNKSNVKAVILNDEVISDNPEGGTGKGLFIQGISKLKKTAIEDGKAFSFDSSFPYQKVSADTQLLVFDDVKKNFDFERMFSIITEGITLEKKNKDAIKIPVEQSPKIVISTNYAIKGTGSSHERRKHEIELIQYYTTKNTPIDEFGRQLFDEWEDDEWLRFFNFMIDCLGVYLKKGLIDYDSKNSEVRKFIASTSAEFYEWVGEGFPINVRNNIKEKFNEFVEEYPDFKKWLQRQRFSSWLQIYSKFKGFEFDRGKSNGKRWVCISDNESEIIDEEDKFDF